jgi:WD40 repeat protein
MVASAGRDGFIRLWDFRRRSLRAEVGVGVPVLRLCHHAGTGLLAAACEDHVIRMYDMEVGPACTAYTAAPLPTPRLCCRAPLHAPACASPAPTCAPALPMTTKLAPV